MEIIYPDNFIKFFNDDDIDDIGEYEIFFDDDDFELDDIFDDDDINHIHFHPKFGYGHHMGPHTSGYGHSMDPHTLYHKRGLFPNPPDYQNQNWQGYDNEMPVWQNKNMPNNNFSIPGSKAPLGSPPLYIPSKKDKGVQHLNPETYGSSSNLKSVSPGSIRFCLYKFTYIWQSNGRSYWAYLINVDRRSVSGFRWVGWRWFYFGVDLRKIDSFICY